MTFCHILLRDVLTSLWIHSTISTRKEQVFALKKKGGKPMGLKFNALCNRKLKMIRVSITSSESTSIMTFNRAERTDDTLTLIRDGVGKLTLSLCETVIRSILVDEHPRMNFKGSINYLSGVAVEVVAM